MSLMKFKSFFIHICSAINVIYSQIKNNEMGGASCTYGGEESCIKNTGGETSQQTIRKT
jgi:hypothetical protein